MKSLLTLQEASQIFKGLFPGITATVCQHAIFEEDKLLKLARLIKYRVPICKYPSHLLDCYKILSDIYWNEVVNRYLNSITIFKKQTQQQLIVKQKKKYSLNNLTEIVNRQIEIANVRQELVQAVQSVKQWKMCFISVKQLDKRSFIKKVDNVVTPQKINHPRTQIILGKNQNEHVKQIRQQLIMKANQNNFIKNEDTMEDQISYILNRVTEKYFEQFYEMLLPLVVSKKGVQFAVKKLILKIQQDSHYIDLNFKIITRLCNLPNKIYLTSSQSKKFNFFQISFVSQLQQTFQTTIIESTQQLNKKKAIGLALLIGKSLKQKLLSKKLLSQCFSLLLTAYIKRKNIAQQNSFSHQLFIELILVILNEIDTFPRSKNDSKQIAELFLQGKQEYIQICSCDYLQILQQINKRLPSKRSKISFLLQDYRCEKSLKLSKTSIQSFNSDNFIKLDKTAEFNSFLDYLPFSIQSECDKDFFKFKKMIQQSAEQKNMFQQAFKIKSEYFMMNSSDCFHLKKTLARMIHFVLGQDTDKFYRFVIDTDDEDIKQFIDKVQSEYNRLCKKE